MAVTRPFHQTVRQFTEEGYSAGGRAKLLHHPSYAVRPDLYIRSFVLLQDDIREVFRFIEPSDTNQDTYSLRTVDLLVRTCVEVEANFKSIFRANRYARAESNANLNATDYFKINRSHYLSDYRIRVPHWTGDHFERRPFQAWSKPDYEPLPWYQAYNDVKHDRALALPRGSFRHLIDAWCGLQVLLTAQFLQEDFSPGHEYLVTGGGVWASEGFIPAVGDYLAVAMPGDIPIEDRYEFDWKTLSEMDKPFDRYNYDANT